MLKDQTMYRAGSMAARTLMIQGTSSSAGKSLLTAGLCRLFARRGLRVAPFKAQNMSNNAAVCGDGGEIGRSQWLQAVAAGVPATVDMNPILLKPEADARSQVIVGGRIWRTLPARRYYEVREELWPVVTSALNRLRSQYDLVVIEGAGSPAELNLRQTEMVNMAVARYARSPVLLVGDIERGGVFAQLLGTLWLLDEADRALVRGLIVNKFRGDPTLFDQGVTMLQERGGVPVLGVVPYVADLHLPEEDAATIDPANPQPTSQRQLDLAVIRLPHISNFDDFDALAAEPGVRLRYVDNLPSLGRPAAVILPGTKSTLADLQWLRERGLAGRIIELAERGASVVGICGGYQMLGRLVRDPLRLESEIEELPGLGLLPTETVFGPNKATHQVQATLLSDRPCPGCPSGKLTGYEIHLAETSGGQPWLKINQRSGQAVCVLDGAVSPDGRVWGCYLHGLFANDAFRRTWLNTLRGVEPASDSSEKIRGPEPTFHERLEQSLDRLADALEASLDMALLKRIVWNH